MLKAIAIDDEPLALKIISNFCEQTEGICLEKTFTSQVDALKYIRKYPVDLLFLDIQMPKKNGISFYKNIDHTVPVIFTTAFQEYAVEGFNLNAIDYLIKPFTFERFEEAVKKALFRRKLEIHSSQQDFIMIRSNYKLNKINLCDIVYIQALDNYVIITLNSGQKITAQITMKEILEKLSAQQFIRIHRSYILNLDYIETANQKSIRINGLDIPVGEKYKNELDRFL